MGRLVTFSTGQSIGDATVREFMSITKALADENRVRVLMFLGAGELCVCQIIEMLGLSPSTVSRHMSVLSAAGLVDSRREGHWIYYRRAVNGPPWVSTALNWLDTSLHRDPTVIRDVRKLSRVRRKSLSKLCDHYKN
jgi:DNA-binding transcriptional ArsR family regulator